MFPQQFINLKGAQGTDMIERWRIVTYAQPDLHNPSPDREKPHRTGVYSLTIHEAGGTFIRDRTTFSAQNPHAIRVTHQKGCFSSTLGSCECQKMHTQDGCTPTGERR
ncbi:hypothetical protein AA103587_0185 [Gluconobacter kanchanaburiensis NBRC 103587]|nr:hypothetical protein AA103587_0185 [Gluconobacter kanchanaburiensis NBRC 103587]